MGLPRPVGDTRPTWEIFLRAQFTRPVERLWSHGAKVVVLAFDDYAMVPKAKAITQAARRARLVPLEFNEDDPLPEFPPEPWTAAMINRTFKARVIQLVVEALPSILQAPEAGSTLIVDWKGCSCLQWEWMEDGTIKHSEMPREPVGEADIKFTRWATRLGVSMGAEATDGDFVPIALMSSTAGLYVLRNEANCEKSNPPSGGGRQQEWVDIDVLRKGLIDCMAIRSQSILPLIVLIAITGTDFSRGLPWVGPKRLVKVLGIFSIARRCLASEEELGDRIDPVQCLDHLVSPVYFSLYRNHAVKGSFADVMGGLTKTPSLSKRVKEKLPSEAQVLTTLRNANFLLQYWAAKDPLAPDSLAPGVYGFRLDGSNRVEWDD